MEVTLINFLNLFDSNVQYSVPKWQRRYSWDKPTIRRLVKDLEAIARADDENARHFGGTLITYSESTPPGTASIHHVVDGQQRLTTISILLACIAEELGPDGSAGQWNSESIRSVLLNNTLKPPRKLDLQDVDDEEYMRVLEGNAGGGGKVAVAGEILRTEVADIGPALLMEGLRRFKVISFTCKSSDDPQQIFESLNATGVPLTEGEKVKNWLLMGLDRETQDEVYRDHWRVLEEHLGAVKEPRSIDHFLRDFLRWKTGENYGIRQTYENLRRWWHVSNAGHDRIWLCKEFARLAMLYGMITGRGGKHGNKRVNQLLEYLRGLGIDVHRPFTLRLLDDATRPDNTGATEKELVESLEAINIWLTRLWLAGSSSAGLNTEFANFAHDRGPQFIEDFSDYWTEKIRKLWRTQIAMPNSEQVEEGIRKRKAYGGRASDAARTVLYVINSKKWKGPAHPRIEDLSLEHIMPRTLSKEWENYLEHDQDEMHENYLNCLANLTLVGPEFNSKISNRNYKEKRELYKDSTVMLTRKLAEQHVDWKKENLLAHGKYLAKLASECWPWEGGPWKGPRWRVDLGEWKREKFYSQVLVNVVAALLDVDPEGNAEQLLGDRAARDIFFADSVPSGSGRFTSIPRHGTYAVNVNFSRKAIFRLCVEMGERCRVKVDVQG